MPIMPNKRQIKAAKTDKKMTKTDKATMKAAGTRRAVINAKAAKEVQGGSSKVSAGVSSKMDAALGKLRNPVPGTAGTKKGATKAELKAYQKSSSKISKAQDKLAKAKQK